jgi:DNA polymerase-3 subunit gamma/tau
MRDGLSLLDQAIVFGEGQVSIAQVQLMLGAVGHQAVGELLLMVASNDAAGALQKVAEIAAYSSDFDSVCDGVIQLLHRTALAQVVPGTLALAESRAVVEELVGAFTPEEVQLYYQIALTGRQDLQLAVDLRSGFEMLLLRMLAFRPLETDQIPCERVSGGEAEQQILSPKGTEEVLEVTETPEASGVPEINDWVAMVAAMNLGGMARQLANNCILNVLTEAQCHLLLDVRFKELHGKKTEQSLLKALERYLGRSIKLVIQTQSLENTTTPAVLINEQIKSRQQAAEQAIDDDEAVRALKDRFSAHVIPGTIEPVKGSEEK